MFGDLNIVRLISLVLMFQLIQSSAPDDGRKRRPKHVQLTRNNKLTSIVASCCRSQWPRGLRRRSAAVRRLRSWVRIPPRAWMFVCCECCVLSGRGLCDELITRPEESYRLWCVVVCDLETSRIGAPYIYIYIYIYDIRSLRVKLDQKPSLSLYRCFWSTLNMFMPLVWNSWCQRACVQNKLAAR